MKRVEQISEITEAIYWTFLDHCLQAISNPWTANVAK